MAKIYLMGNDHRDWQNGPRKLEAAYTRLNPNIVVSEYDFVSYSGLERICDEFSAQLDKISNDKSGKEKVRGMFELVAYGFPLGFNRKYAAQNGIYHVFADLPHAHSGNCQTISGLGEMILALISSHNGEIEENAFKAMELMKDRPPTQEYLQNVWEYYMRTENSLSNELKLFKLRLAGLIGKRDAHMETMIRAIYPRGGIIVYPVGFVHLQDSILKSTLYSRIKDLNPERIPILG